MYLRKLFTVVFLVTFFAVTSIYPAPSFSSPYANLTRKEERELGQKLMYYVKRQFRFVRDPYIVGYVNKVGREIVRQVANPPFDFQFYVLKEDVYNAFAGPGGHIFVNSGLLAAMTGEEQLAGILGHEMAHVLCRHISEQIARSKKINIATTIGMLAGAFLGGGSEAGSALSQGSAAAGQAVLLKYSRENEEEADKVGMKYLTKAGYGGEGLLVILKKMRAKQWFGSETIPTYVSTHPALEARMAYLDTWIQTHPQKAGLTRSVRTTDFQKARTRVIALYGDLESAGDTFDSEIREDPKDAFAYYGKGLLLDRDGQSEAALKYIKEAMDRRPLDPDIYRDLGITYFNMGDHPKALKVLKAVVSYFPKDPEGWFYIGRAQLESGDPQGAVESFKTMLSIVPKNLYGKYYLGQAYGRLGEDGEAHYNLGMYYMGRRQFKNARFHLERALEILPDDSEKRQTAERALKDLSEHPESDRS